MDLRSYAIANELVGNDNGCRRYRNRARRRHHRVFECAPRISRSRGRIAAPNSTATDRDLGCACGAGGIATRIAASRAWMRTTLAIEGGLDVPLRARVAHDRSHRRNGRLFTVEPCAQEIVSCSGATRGEPRRAGCRTAAHRFVFARSAQPLGGHLWGRIWTVGHESNRMGYRLQGAAVPHDIGAMPSHAVFPGFIQLPPSGEPIVLMSDAQTTGGYPLAGVVIEEDLWMLAQAPIGAQVRFVEYNL